jgi:predicted AlkP superfamily pyrophosphatase or phosphodiesterase
LKSSIVTLLTLTALGVPTLQAQLAGSSAAKPAAHPPKLIVAIIVDQFRYDYTTRFASRYTGGLHTMLTQGAVFVDAHQDHYPTVTATGHATFMTGSTPATSGIIGNEWFDRTQGHSITSVEDADTSLLGGKPGATGSSPHNLLISTLGDELKIADHNTTRVIGISMKDRAAILPAGRMADAAYWIDDTSGGFVSSTWYQQSLPFWVESFNAAKPAERFLGKSWFAPGAEQKGEKPFVVLPAAMGKPYISAFETTPWSNDMLEDFAEQALQHEELGHHNGTDLLTISFSANDHLGHAIGPDDPAIDEISIRTDQAIGKLIAAAEKQVGGAQNLVVVMSADHGVAPVPEVNLARKMPGGRVDKAAYTQTVQEALDNRFGKARWIIGSWESGFYFDQNLIREHKLTPAEVEDEAARAVGDLPYVERTYTRTQLMNRQAMASVADDYVARSFFPSRGPDLFVVFKPYWLFGKGGTSHGTPWNYDTHVPLLFFGAGIHPGTYSERVGISDVAPTLAALLHVETPSGSVGHILSEIVDPTGLPSKAGSTRKH